MKDLTHYFTDLQRDSENASVSLKKVRSERAKIEDTEEAINKESISKKKREKVKIKILKKFTEGTVCNISESCTDIVNKVPSLSLIAKRRQSENCDETPKTKTTRFTPECNDRNRSSHVIKQSENNVHQVIKNRINDFIPGKINDVISNDKYKDKISIIDSKKKKETYTEKLIHLANKNKYLKRKNMEDDQAVKIEKRKKMLTVGSNQNVECTQTEELTPKNYNSACTKHSSNLLNYFSKATPEQIEKERLLKAKVTVKAEIHSQQNSLVPLSFNLNNTLINKDELNSKQENSKSQEKFDEICVIQSEMLTSPPNIKKLKSPLQYNKPKWSLKIQLHSNSMHVSDSINDEIYIPSPQENTYEENNDKIPKVLLPIKNKKFDLINPPYEIPKNNEKNETEIIQIREYTKLREAETNSIGVRKQLNEKCKIIEKDNSKKKSNEKLAPLFTKKVKPNSELTTAQRLFLQSDISEKNIVNENKKFAPDGPLILPFPKVSHVTQLSLSSCISASIHCFSLKNNEKLKSTFELLQFKTISKFRNDQCISQNLYECIKLDVDSILLEIKSYCSDAQSLWNSINMLSKEENSKQIPRIRRKSSDKKKLKESKENTKDKSLNSLWTEKYKPKSTYEIVGNEEAASKLKSWLFSWKILKNDEDLSSSEEFYGSDCSISSNGEHNQVAVLVGPHGSGKTASVYAVAHELGYQVLELNASSKRPGKKIFKDFEEATKSHRVKKYDLNNIFIPISKKVDQTKKITENSLILLEDIDLIFEEDEGFVSAAFQLASNTKRPIVMTLRNTCSYLSKMAPQQFHIDFQPVSGKRVFALLQLITLAETRCKLPQDFVNVLCQNGDLRKSLLQLQYLLLSGKKCISLCSLAVDISYWNDVQTHIYKPAIKEEKRKKKKELDSDTNNHNNIFHNLVDNLDKFTLISTLINIEDPTSYTLNLKYEPSVSLVENINSYSSLKVTSLEIGKWLYNGIKKSILNNSKKLNHQIYKSNYHLLTKKLIINDVNAALSQIALFTLDKRVLSVDYLSNIRTICRAEEIRNQINVKRGNRFFHYLHNSKISNGSMKSGCILSAACEMLEEKSSVNSKI